MKALARLLVSLGVLLLAATAWAATQNATVYGTVFDATGNPLPGVSVVLENAALGFSRTAISGSDGTYNFAEVPPADGYKITASKDGKTLDIRAGIAVNVGDERLILPPLKEQAAAAAAGGKVEEKSGQAVSNDALSTTISGVITGDQLRSLPLYNRNFLVLGLLTPNVRDTEPGSELEGASFSISGTRPSSNNFLLDGADNVASSSNQAVPFVVNDAVQEFRVTSSTASVEFGRGLGGVVNIVTRRGGNALHGSAFGYFATDALNANSPLSVYNGGTFDQAAAYAGDPATVSGFQLFPLTYNDFVASAESSGWCTNSITLPVGLPFNCAGTAAGQNDRFDPAAILAANDRRDRPFSSQQFGVNLGGALIQDKWFGFVSYEGTRIDNPNPVLERVPSAFDRDYDPFNLGTFNFLPTDPNYVLAQNVLSLYPAPNLSGTPGMNGAVPGVLEFFRGEAPDYTNVHNLILRSDYRSSDHDRWGVRYVGQKLDQLHDATLPATGTYPGNGAFRDAFNQNLVISYSRDITATVINEFRIGFNRFNVEEKAQDRLFDATTLGLPFSEMPTFFLNGIDNQNSGQRPDTDFFPFNESGAFTQWPDCCNSFPTLDYLFPMARLGAPLGAPSDRRDTTLFVSDSLSFSVGKHNLRLGGEFRHLRNDFQNDAFRRGFVYSSNIGEFTSNSEDCNEECNVQFGGFTFTAPGGAFSAPSFDFAQSVAESYRGKFRSWATAGYLQDTWRFHPRWTLNFGVRYEYFSPIKERGDQIWNYDPAANGLVQQGRTGPVSDPYGNTCGTIPTEYDSLPDSVFPFIGDPLTPPGTPGSVFVAPQGWSCTGTGNGEIVNSDRNNFAPRGGLAWDMFGDGKTVARFGIGWYYDQLPASSVIPLLYNRPLSGPNAVFGRVQDGFGSSFILCFNFTIQCGLGNTMLDPAVRAAPDPFGFMPNSFYTEAVQPFAVTARDFARSNAPYARQISAGIQQQVNNHLAFEVGYVGTSGKQLPVVFNSNFTKEWDVVNNPFEDNFAFTPIFTMTNQGDSSYHSMMARVRAADWHGLRLHAAYSLSNAEDNASSALLPTLPLTGPNTILPYQNFQTGSFVALCIYAPTLFCDPGVSPRTPQINFAPGAVTTTGAGQVLVSRYNLPQDPFNFLNNDLGRSDFHTKHRFVLDYTWDVPYWKESKWMGNWQISGIFVAQSGQPFTIFSPILNEITQRASDSGPVTVTNNPDGAIDPSNLILPLNLAACRPDTGGTTNPGFLYLAAPGNPCTGMTRRNQFTGPNFAGFNLAIQKGFAVFGEGRMLSLRAELYNLTDRANFFNPISTLSQDGVNVFGDFGKIKSAHEARQVQFAVRFTW